MNTEPALAVPLTSNGTTPMRSNWTIIQRVGFRLVFCYFVLYAAPAEDLTDLYDALPLPGLGYLTSRYVAAWRGIGNWVASGLFHIQIHDLSGDSVGQFLYTFCLLAAASFAALIWSYCDRRSNDYITLHA